MFELSKDRRVPSSIEPNDTYAEFVLHWLGSQSPPWKGERYCHLKLETENDLIDQIRCAGVEMNGMNESPFPGLSASYAKIYTPKNEGDVSPENIIERERNSIETIYFGWLLPASEKKPQEDHLLPIPKVGAVIEKDWYVLTRSGLSFDLTKSDIVIAAANHKKIQKEVEGQLVYERGVPRQQLLNQACNC